MHFHICMDEVRTFASLVEFVPALLTMGRVALVRLWSRL